MEKFTTNDTIKFLKKYKQLTCLWKYSDFNYRNRAKRLSALNELAKYMNVPNFGPKEAQLKIHSLRNTYLAEKRKATKKENIKSSTESTYMPKLRWFDIADTFLYNVVQSKNGETNLDIPERRNTTEVKTKGNQSVTLPLKEQIHNNHSVIRNVKNEDIAMSMDLAKTEHPLTVEVNTSSKPKQYKSTKHEELSQLNISEHSIDELKHKQSIKEINWFEHPSTVEVSSSSKLNQCKPTKHELSHFSISKTIIDDVKSRQRTKEFESFGVSVVDQLNSLPIEMAFEAQASIQNLLTEKKIEALRMEQSAYNLDTVSESISSGEFIVLSPGSVDGIVEISQDGDSDIYYEYI